MIDEKKPNILVLLSTYNGERFLRTLLDSVLQQRGVNCHILARDDGSKDKTRDILAKYMEEGHLEYFAGQNIGPTRSFFELFKKAKEYDDYEYFALCDQDDYWEDIKCKMAIEKIKKMSVKYKLYTSSLNMCNEKLELVRTIKNREYSYEESFLRNSSAGCTMVFNKQTLDLLNIYFPEDVFIHDWWTKQLVQTVNDSEIYYDANSYIKYRIHEKNVMGKNRSKIRKVLFKIHQFGRRRNYSSIFARELLTGYYNMIPFEKKRLLDSLCNYKMNIGKTIFLIKTYKKIQFSSRKRKAFFYIDLLSCNL